MNEVVALLFLAAHSRGNRAQCCQTEMDLRTNEISPVNPDWKRVKWILGSFCFEGALAVRSLGLQETWVLYGTLISA